MLRITAKEMLEEAQQRSNRIDYDKIALAETIIQTIIKSQFDTTGTTCFDIGDRMRTLLLRMSFIIMQKVWYT